MSELLLPIGTNAIPTTTESFHAKEKLKLKKDGGICSIFGDRFENEFLSGEGLIEDPIEGHDLYEYQLLKKSKSDPIINEFCGKEKIQSTLTGMVYLMRNDFLQRDCGHVFCIKNMAGVLRNVYVLWECSGWIVGAYSVRHMNAWHVGVHVFSGNSLKL